MPTYIAMIHKDADSSYAVTFPDLPGVVTAGGGIDEAMQHVAEALEFAAGDWKRNGRKGLPAPRTIDELRSDAEFQENAADAVVAAVPFRAKAEAAE